VDGPWDVVPPRIKAEAEAAGVTRARPADWPAPCPLDEGIEWARAMLAQGYYLDHLVDPDSGVVWFKLWEYGEDEPSWADVLRQARFGPGFT